MRWYDLFGLALCDSRFLIVMLCYHTAQPLQDFILGVFRKAIGIGKVCVDCVLTFFKSSF